MFDLLAIISREVSKTAAAATATAVGLATTTIIFLIALPSLHLLMGIICAIVASNKGRSGIGWFFLGLLLGIIALIIIACLSNKKTWITSNTNVYYQAQQNSTRSISQETGWICSNCGQSNDLDAKFCKGCGKPR